MFIFIGNNKQYLKHNEKIKQKAYYTPPICQTWQINTEIDKMVVMIMLKRLNTVNILHLFLIEEIIDGMNKNIWIGIHVNSNDTPESLLTK